VQARWCRILRNGGVGMRRVHQIKQSPERLLWETFVSPDHDFGREDVHRVPFWHPGRSDPIKIPDREQIDIPFPLIIGDQRIRCQFGSAAIQREPVGDHVDKQLFHDSEAYAKEP